MRRHLLSRPAITALAVTTAVAVGVLPASQAFAGPGSATSQATYQTSAVTVTNGHGRSCANLRANTINDHDVIGGSFYCTKHDNGEGFLETSGGKVTKFFAPKAKDDNTVVDAIADDGTAAITVYAQKGSGTLGYLRSPAGKFTAVKDPKDPNGSVFLSGINSHHCVTGSYGITKKLDTGHPFVYCHHKFRSFTAHVKGATGVQLTGISNSGELSGSFNTESGVSKGLLVVHGKDHVVVAPGAGTKKGQGTFLNTLAGNGTYAGTVIKGKKYRQFVHTSGGFTFFSLKSSLKDAFTQGVNGIGDAVGIATYSGYYVGYLATPNATTT